MNEFDDWELVKIQKLRRIVIPERMLKAAGYKIGDPIFLARTGTKIELLTYSPGAREE